MCRGLMCMMLAMVGRLTNDVYNIFDITKIHDMKFHAYI